MTREARTEESHEKQQQKNPAVCKRAHVVFVLLVTWIVQEHKGGGG